MTDLNFKTLFARACAFSGLILVFFLTRAFWDWRDPINWGLILGTAAGLLNGFLLAGRLEALAGMRRSGPARALLGGLGTRMAVVFAVLFLGLQSDLVSLLGVAAGLFVMPVVFMLVAIDELVREARRVRSTL
ncbi:MAG: ATP synthase subunit I [Firmicutes bacterium]|nr:ATP synthase subunit I [Bacillota bacterium]